MFKNMLKKRKFYLIQKFDTYSFFHLENTSSSTVGMKQNEVQLVLKTIEIES